MKLHRNAKTTPHMRALLVDRIRHQQWTPATAASAAGISVRSAYKWLARHRGGGVAALEDRTSRPHGQPRRTSPAMTARIVAARYERRTAWAIAVRLQVPRSTVAAVLARVGLNRLARLTPPAPVTRYEWAHPGDLVHFDVKPLARIAGVGHRIHGDRRARVEGIGWEYAHVAIDDHSRCGLGRGPARSNRRHHGGFSSTHRGLVCAPRGPHHARPDRQRGQLSQSTLSGGGQPAHATAETRAPVSPTDQWQGGTLHPNADA